jgi:hypothetical protein
MLITAKVQSNIQKEKNELLENNKINKNEYTLTDLSLLLNTSRKLLWKKITKEENNFYLTLNEAYSTLKFEMFKNDFGYYTTQENIEKLKLFITENEDFLSTHISFKEGINQITNMNNNFYKNIKDDKIKFIKNNSLFIVPVLTSNNSLYLKKEDITEANKTNSSFKYYNKKSILSLLEKIDYAKYLNKEISKNKYAPIKLNLTFNDFTINISSENYNGQHFFSIKEIEKTYFFVNKVKEKLQNLIKLNKTKKQMKKYFFDSPYRLCSKEKKISVKLEKINDNFYYNMEDKEKIKELFN